jgi:hypothetical protein
LILTALLADQPIEKHLPRAALWDGSQSFVSCQILLLAKNLSSASGK